MKIEKSESFILDDIVWRKSALVPSNEENEQAKEFIRYYKTYGLTDANKQYPERIKVTTALCTLGENETWESAAKELKNGGWFGSSMIFWELYTQGKKTAIPNSVALPGVRYRDDEFVEWFPVVHHEPLVSFFGSLRGSKTKIKMKQILSLEDKKQITVLISKIEILKD